MVNVVLTTIDKANIFGWFRNSPVWVEALLAICAGALGIYMFVNPVGFVDKMLFIPHYMWASLLILTWTINSLSLCMGVVIFRMLGHILALISSMAFAVFFFMNSIGVWPICTVLVLFSILLIIRCDYNQFNDDQYDRRRE